MKKITANSFSLGKVSLFLINAHGAKKKGFSLSLKKCVLVSGL
jgi:hypothetical protein